MNKRTKKEKTTKTSNQKRTRKHLRVVENWAPVETNAAKHETTTALSETISEKIETIGAAVETSDKSDASYLSAAADSPAPAVDLDTEPTQSEVPLTLSTEDAISVVIVNREALLNGLKVAKDFIGKKNTMPILSSALLTVRRDELGRSFITLAVTDLEVSWKTTYPCEATAEISQCAPLDTLYSEVKALPGDITDAVLAFKKNAVQVNNRCDIYTMPGEEYPQLPQVEGDSVKVSITALRSVLPAVGQNDARYVLNGALLDFTKGLAIGTDGHRLHMADIEKQDRSNIILPRTAAEIISKHGGNEVTFQVRDNKFTCKLADGDMTGKLIDGNYPNYEQVIPVSAPITVEFSAKDMMKVFEGCLPIINQKSHAVAFIVNGKIEVQATSSERGIYKWHVPGTITGKGPDELKIGFNVLYLQDAFRAYAGAEGAGVTMAMSDPLSPCLIACPRTSESGGKAVVMPMRV